MPSLYIVIAALITLGTLVLGYLAFTPPAPNQRHSRRIRLRTTERLPVLLTRLHSSGDGPPNSLGDCDNDRLSSRSFTNSDQNS